MTNSEKEQELPKEIWVYGKAQDFVHAGYEDEFNQIYRALEIARGNE